MNGEARRFDEIPRPEIEGLLRKLAWALVQDAVPRSGTTIPFYRVDHRFIEAALDLIRETAEKHRESYRREMGAPG